jgi:hypothetical protein
MSQQPPDPDDTEPPAYDQPTWGGPVQGEPIAPTTPPTPPGPPDALPPAYGHPPAYGAQPPPYGAQPPGYGGYPAGYGGYPPQPYLYVNHQLPQATTALWLGIAGVGGPLLGFMCCLTLPLVVCAPIALGLGLSARRTIDAAPPGAYANRGQAVAGFVLGIIGTVLGALAILSFLAVFSS